MQLEKVRHTAKAHTTGAFGLPPRILIVFFAATVSLAPTVTALAQQPAYSGAQPEGTFTAHAAGDDAIRSVSKETSLNPPDTGRSTDPTAIRPFRVNVPQEALDDLRRRINAAKWPERVYVTDQTQGVQLATAQKLARYWATDYDWRKAEAKLNALPQFITEIDGLDIHFIHVRSKHQNALPLIVTHGWPGSVIEQLKIIGPLTDPTAYG